MEKENLEKAAEDLEGATREIRSGEHLTFNTIKHCEIIIDSEAKLTVNNLIESTIIVRAKGILEVLGTWTDCDITWQ